MIQAQILNATFQEQIELAQPVSGWLKEFKLKGWMTDFHAKTPTMKMFPERPLRCLHRKEWPPCHSWETPEIDFPEEEDQLG